MMARPLSLLVLIFVTVEAAVIPSSNVQIYCSEHPSEFAASCPYHPDSIIMYQQHQQPLATYPAFNRMNGFPNYQLVRQPMKFAYTQEQVAICPQHPRHSIGNCPHHRHVSCPYHRPQQYVAYQAVNQQQQFMPSSPYQPLPTVFNPQYPQQFIYLQHQEPTAPEIPSGDSNIGYSYQDVDAATFDAPEIIVVNAEGDKGEKENNEPKIELIIEEPQENNEENIVQREDGIEKEGEPIKEPMETDKEPVVEVVIYEDSKANDYHDPVVNPQ